MSTAERYHKVYQVSWDQLHRDCRALAWKLIDRPWERIVGIARGGLIPAAIMARELEVHLVDTVCLSSYEKSSKGEREQGRLTVLKNLQLTGDLSRTLVVDDLVDTGSTASFAREMFPGATFVTVYAKPAGRKYLDYFVTEVSQDTWILFPWDAESGYAEPIISRRA